MEETRRDGEEVSGRKLLHPVPGSYIYADILHDIRLTLLCSPIFFSNENDFNHVPSFHLLLS